MIKLVTIYKDANSGLNIILSARGGWDSSAKLLLLVRQTGDKGGKMARYS